MYVASIYNRPPFSAHHMQFSKSVSQNDFSARTTSGDPSKIRLDRNLHFWACAMGVFLQHQHSEMGINRFLLFLLTRKLGFSSNFLPSRSNSAGTCAFSPYACAHVNDGVMREVVLETCSCVPQERRPTHRVQT